MKRTFVFALLAFLLATSLYAQAPTAAPAPAAARADPQSVALVNALRLREVIVQTTSAGVADAQKRGAASQEGTTCVAQLLFQDLGTDLALTVPKILTRAEIIASLEFFQSPTGRKLISHNLAMLWQQYNGAPNPKLPDPPPTEDDTKQARAFLATPAGRKINQSGYLLQSPEMQRVIKAKSDAAIARCRKPAK
jgi:hypothetical protein